MNVTLFVYPVCFPILFIHCDEALFSQYGECREFNIEKYVTTNTTITLTSLTTFQGKWIHYYNSSSPLMKVYNSFNYTQDIKYEARLLELPFRDNEFKLAIVIPNETDVLNGVIRKLPSEGFDASLNCIQPLFVTTSELAAPSIDFTSNSNMECQETIYGFTIGSSIQHGIVKIDEKGPNVKVYTYISNEKTESVLSSGQENNEKSFYFAIIFNNNAIITGQYYK